VVSVPLHRLSDRCSNYSVWAARRLNCMSNSVVMIPDTDAQLLDAQGHRLYLTADERTAFLAATKEAPRAR
jgi:uncharacterized protein (UPF0261 family)